VFGKKDKFVQYRSLQNDFAPKKREIYKETGLLNNESLGINQRYLHHFFTFPKIHASLWKA